MWKHLYPPTSAEQVGLGTGRTQNGPRSERDALRTGRTQNGTRSPTWAMTPFPKRLVFHR